MSKQRCLNFPLREAKACRLPSGNNHPKSGSCIGASFELRQFKRARAFAAWWQNCPLQGRVQGHCPNAYRRKQCTSRLSRARPLVERHGTGSDRRMLTERSRRLTEGKPARRPAVRSRSRPAARNTPIRCPGRALAASAPVTAPDAPAESHGLTAVAPRLEPELAPDFISGTRAFDAHPIKRDFPILHHRPSLPVSVVAQDATPTVQGSRQLSLKKLSSNKPSWADSKQAQVLAMLHRKQCRKPQHSRRGRADRQSAYIRLSFSRSVSLN